MKILQISKRKFKQISKYTLESSITNNECDLFILEQKDKWNYEKILIKKLKKTSGGYFSNKLYTVNTLIDNRENLDIDELVLPEKLFVLDDKIEGFVMPFVENNINLSLLLNNPNLSLLKKIEILKKIGNLLNKIIYLSDKANNFFLGDVHDGNFIYDKDKKIFRAVDLDSCKIGNNDSSISKYLTFNVNLWDFPNKYPLNEDDVHISNKNTTILSYIYMILNTISNHRIDNIFIEEYYSYLQYLKDNGFKQELIDMFANVYTNADNNIDLGLLESIPTNKGFKLTFEQYKK